MEGRISVDVERCTACKRCILACAVEHSSSNDLLAAIAESPAPRPRVRLVDLGGAAVPIECAHCDAAACVAACPTGAMWKQGTSGPVLLGAERCVGCGCCIVACPYGVIRQRLETAEVWKCDLCPDRLSRGRVPACVEACPTSCLGFRADAAVEGWISRLTQLRPESASARAVASCDERGEGDRRP